MRLLFYVQLAFVAVHMVPSHRPLPLAQCEAVLRSVCHSSRVINVVGNRPSFFQSDSGGKASLEPNISQTVWPLYRGELEPHKSILSPDMGGGTNPSEEDQRRKLLVLARTTCNSCSLSSQVSSR